MLKVLAVLAISLAVAPVLGYAQATEASWKDVYAGAFFTPGAAVSAGPVIDGYKTSSRFAYTLGVTGDIPLAPTTGIDLSLAYDQRAINFHNQANEAIRTDYTFSYVAIRPMLRLSSFLIGFGFGVPASSTAESSTNGATTTSTPITTGNIKPLVELRAGTSLPIIESDAGKLNLMVQGSYPLMTIYSNRPAATESKNNGPIATLELGLSYLFNMNRH